MAIWFLGPLPLQNPACISGCSQFMYCWSLAQRILNITRLACEIKAIVQYFEFSLPLPFLGDYMKTDLFQFCGHCWVFQLSWHIEWSTFTAPSFRILKSSVEISSPLLALVMLLKAHFTSHSRMPGSRWVITPSWLLRHFLFFYVFSLTLPSSLLL